MSFSSSGFYYCEGLFQILLPNFYSSILKNSAHKNFYNYLTNELNEISNNNDRLTTANNLTVDLLNHFNTCALLESKLLYLIWFLNLIEPFVTTVFVVLLILPLLVCLIIYSTSIYLLFTKHWKRFKVSCTHLSNRSFCLFALLCYFCFNSNYISLCY